MVRKSAASFVRGVSGVTNPVAARRARSIRTVREVAWALARLGGVTLVGATPAAAGRSAAGLRDGPREDTGPRASPDSST
jgi:hypothetical protein